MWLLWFVVEPPPPVLNERWRTARVSTTAHRYGPPKRPAQPAIAGTKKGARRRLDAPMDFGVLIPAAHVVRRFYFTPRLKYRASVSLRVSESRSGGGSHVLLGYSR